MDLHTTLKHDHARLERLFEALSNAVESADQPTLAGMWDEFESSLLAHLELEERYLLPAVEAQHPSAAEMLIGEHKEIRKRVAELGVRTDLHLLRKEVADELIELLRNHAGWEDRTLYPWAERALSERAKRARLARICRQRRLISSRRPRMRSPSQPELCLDLCALLAKSGGQHGRSETSRPRDRRCPVVLPASARDGLVPVVLCRLGAGQRLRAPFRDQFGLTGTQTALLVAVPVLLGALARLPMGMLADRFGGRAVFAVADAGSRCRSCCVPAAPSFELLLAVAFFLGLAGASFSVGVGYVSRWTPPERQGATSASTASATSGSRRRCSSARCSRRSSAGRPCSAAWRCCSSSGASPSRCWRATRRARGAPPGPRRHARRCCARAARLGARRSSTS